jgi:hypothetical protein
MRRPEGRRQATERRVRSWGGESFPFVSVEILSHGQNERLGLAALRERR